ncbi:MAG: hypothetical protein JXA74_08075, partial [Anaerolineae bacterium]|nr:hypothetical protein [Anaerolineae bacterium]
MALRIEQAHSAEHLVMPGWDEPFTVALPDEIQALRDRALALHAEYGTQALTSPELTLAEARAWSTHTQDENWLVWRARLCAERLESMPLELEPGERLVGKPHLRALTPADRARLEEAETILASMPPFPGGDAGHFHPDYEKLFRVGLGGLRDEIRSRRAHAAGSQRAFYGACEIAIQATIAYVQRVGRACEEISLRDPEHSGAWLELADICRQVATHPPTTFHQAIQLMFLMQIALWFGEKHYLTAPGRMDQTLFPFYAADLAAGRITRREAFELIACLY